MSPLPVPPRPAAMQAVVAVAAVAGLALCWMLAQPFWKAIFAAAVLAVVFEPLHSRLAARLRRRSLAALLATILVAAVVLVPAVLTGIAAVQELRHAYGYFKVESARQGGWFPYIEYWMDRPLEWIAQRTGSSAAELRDGLFDRLAQAGASVLRFLTSLITELSAGVMHFFIALLSLFFLFRDGPSITRLIADVAPLPPGMAPHLLRRTAEILAANAYGVVAVASVQGFLTGLGLSLAGIPSPVLWGLAAALCSLIPFVGTGLVWLPAALYLLASGFWGKALFLAAWGAGLVSMVDNLVRPWVVGGRVNLHPLLIFFSLLGGVQAFGLSGVFLGPLAVSLTGEFIAILSNPSRILPPESTGR